MNYNIKLCGRAALKNTAHVPANTMHVIAKLILESISASDYITHTYSRPVLAAYSPLVLELEVIGSSKKDTETVVLDFDGYYIGESADLYLNPDILDLERVSDLSHYWGVTGTLFKIIPDLSPAYITSYLMENKMNNELALFKKYSTLGLPVKERDDV